MFKIFKRNKNRNSEYNMEVLNTTQPKRVNVREDGSTITPIEKKAQKIINMNTQNMSSIQLTQYMKDIDLIVKEIKVTSIPIKYKQQMVSKLKDKLDEMNLIEVVKTTEEASRTNLKSTNPIINCKISDDKPERTTTRLVAGKYGENDKYRVGISRTKTNIAKTEVDRRMIIENVENLTPVSTVNGIMTYVDEKKPKTKFKVFKINEKTTYAVSRNGQYMSESTTTETTTDATNIVAAVLGCAFIVSKVKAIGVKATGKLLYKIAKAAICKYEPKKFMEAVNKAIEAC